jgi:RNase P/RNase MRP subunit POP5
MKKAKDKMLKLKKSARDHRRYFLINEVSNEIIEKAILDYIGILGFAKSAYKRVKVKKNSNKTIGSCLRSEQNNVHAALVLSGIGVEKISNTIKGLEK